ncbi:MAG: ankyrin repeat domain-containing protein [Cytophagaceae bacterium]|nr:MAG: ankyrin repeat domain-containing protein [Cytophagaceae bacterium]
MYITAIGHSNIKVLKCLVEHKIDPNVFYISHDPYYRDPKKTLLMEVVHNKEMTQLLIEAGADINAKDVNGQTVLHYAAKNRSSGTVIDILFRAGAKLTKDIIGNMPLHLLLRWRFVELLMILSLAWLGRRYR